MIVDNITQFNRAINYSNLIIIKDGTYRNFYSKITQSNIVIKAETPNKVYFKENSWFEVTGSNITFIGFNFKDCNVKNNFKIKGNNNRVSNCIFYEYNTNFEHLIILDGVGHRVDHCLFEDIKFKGLCIFLYRSDNTANYCLIDHNIFRNRFPVPNITNELEIIRIGTSHKSQSDSKSIIINNIFEACDGEIETISIKAGDNIVANNSLINCKGSLTLRHGNNNIICMNLIDQKNKYDSGGIRIIGDSHFVSHNIIQNVNSRKSNNAPISVVAGQENPKLNGYWNVKDTIVQNNYIIDCSNGFSIGTRVKSTCKLKPEKLVIRDNKCVLNYNCFGFCKSSSAQYNNEANYTNNLFHVYDLGKISSNKGIIKKSYISFNRGEIDYDKYGTIGNDIGPTLNTSNDSIDVMEKHKVLKKRIMDALL